MIIKSGHTVSTSVGVNAVDLTIESGATMDFIDNGGFLGTGGITNNGTINMTQPSPGFRTHVINSDISNNGAINWTGGGLNCGSITITNNNFSAFSITVSNAQFDGVDIVNESGGNINLIGTGNQFFPGVLTNKTGGMISIEEGKTFSCNGSLDNQGGDIDIAGTLALSNGSHSYEGGDISGAGFLNFAGNLTLTSVSGFESTVDTIIHQSGATINAGANSSFTVTPGQVFQSQNSNTIGEFDSFTNNGTMNLTFISPAVITHVVNCNLINNGTLNWLVGSFNSNTGDTLINYGNYDIFSTNFSSSINVINKNGGLITKKGTSQATLLGDVVNEAGGDNTNK